MGLSSLYLSSTCTMKVKLNFMGFPIFFISVSFSFSFIATFLEWLLNIWGVGGICYFIKERLHLTVCLRAGKYIKLIF